MRSGYGLAALTVLGLLLTSTQVLAAPPILAPPSAAESTPTQVLAAPLSSGAYRPELAPTLGTLGSLAPVETLGPSVYAKRSRDRKFDTQFGEVDPRKRQLPRTHRFRLAIHSQWVRLTRTFDDQTDEYVRFHFAPLMLDVAYQAQFLKYVMVRLAVAAGGNVANTRNAMPGVLFPQAYVGVQTRVLGVAFGYGFDWTIPPIVGAVAPNGNLVQPVIANNHVVMGEVSATSKIDRVALTFSLMLGGAKGRLSHYETHNYRFRFFLGLQAGVFFDGTLRREKSSRSPATEKKARKAAAGRR